MKIPSRHRIQPCETLYSWAARWLRVGGFLNERHFKEEVVGAGHMRIHPYLPHNLTRWSEVLEIPEKTLMAGHTLFPLFSAFRCDGGEELEKAMRGVSAKALSVAGVPHARLHFFDGNKFCPCCAEEDKKKLGFAYFRVYHQIPGVDSCGAHGCLLVGIQGGDTGYDRKLVLPYNGTVPQTAAKQQAHFARFTHNVWLKAGKFAAPIDFASCYSQRLEQMALCASSGQLRAKGLLLKIHQFYNGWEFDGRMGIPKDLADFKFVTRLLRKGQQYNVHPLKHLIVGFWLFEGRSEGYWPLVQMSQPATSETIDKDLRSQAVSLLRDGKSLAFVASKLGKSRCYVRRVAELACLPHKTNSAAYSQRTRVRIQLLARLGRARQEIAEKLEVGIGYVEQVISNTPRLSEHRRRLQIEKKTQWAKAVLSLTRALNPSWRRKEIKEARSRAFFHLYHHNRKLLERLLPPKTPPRVPPQDWSAKDHEMVQAIRDLQDVENMSLTAISAEIGAGSRLHKNIKRFPKTRSLLMKLNVLA